MIRYHVFDTEALAREFLAFHRTDGGLGYYLGRVGVKYEVRTIH